MAKIPTKMEVGYQCIVIEEMRYKVSVRFGEKLYTAISKVAEKYERNKSDIIREAVAEWLERKGYL